jgi:hypothetical protein
MNFVISKSDELFSRITSSETMVLFSSSNNLHILGEVILLLTQDFHLYI